MARSFAAVVASCDGPWRLSATLLSHRNGSADVTALVRVRLADVNDAGLRRALAADTHPPSPHPPSHLPLLFSGQFSKDVELGVDPSPQGAELLTAGEPVTVGYPPATQPGAAVRFELTPVIKDPAESPPETDSGQSPVQTGFAVGIGFSAATWLSRHEFH